MYRGENGYIRGRYLQKAVPLQRDDITNHSYFLLMLVI